MRSQVRNVRIDQIRRITSPGQMRRKIRVPRSVYRQVVKDRQDIVDILTGHDERVLVIVGPCSIHDQKAALEYASRLKALSEDVNGCFKLVMRAYFSKPRTTLGWKGMMADPMMDGTCDMEHGLMLSRRIASRIVSMGVPIATEVLDPFTVEFLADLVSWASIGARTASSQTHREPASGLSMPVGFKNSPDGTFRSAIDAIETAKNSHTFLGVNGDGHICQVRSTGNPLGHLVLRGGSNGPNYDSASLDRAIAELGARGLNTNIIVDCSHDNCRGGAASGKDYRLQEVALVSVMNSRRVDAAGQPIRNPVVGFMLESNLEPGKQPLDIVPAPVGSSGRPSTGSRGSVLKRLKYGVSVTDDCLGWDDTERLIREQHELFRSRRLGTGV